MSADDEGLRVRVALAMGAKWYLFGSGYTWLSFKDLKAAHGGSWVRLDSPDNPKRIVIGDTVPDYLNSLDAMHEAEKTAFTGHPELWAQYIDEELPKACQSDTEDCTPPECATARQRALAFLAVMEPTTEGVG